MLGTVTGSGVAETTVARIIVLARKPCDINVREIVTRWHALLTFRIQKSRPHRMALLQTVNNVFRR